MLIEIHHAHTHMTQAIIGVFIMRKLSQFTYYDSLWIYKENQIIIWGFVVFMVLTFLVLVITFAIGDGIALFYAYVATIWAIVQLYVTVPYVIKKQSDSSTYTIIVRPGSPQRLSNQIRIVDTPESSGTPLPNTAGANDFLKQLEGMDHWSQVVSTRVGYEAFIQALRMFINLYILFVHALYSRSSLSKNIATFQKKNTIFIARSLLCVVSTHGTYLILNQ